MKTHVGSVVLVFIGLLGLLGLTAGCSVLPEVQPDLTRYYVLTPVAPAAEAAPAPERPRRISLRVTDMPAFLRGQLMKVRVAENEVRFVDEARWAEPLESGLARVMRNNFDLRATEDAVSLGLGMLLIGIFAASHFGRFHGGNTPRNG